jgi:hypothetical protein
VSAYRNALESPAALAGWIAEGPVRIDQGPSGVILSSEPSVTDDGHWTLWCPDRFTDDIRITWEFRPVSEPGLAMLFFAASGHHPGGLFSPDQPPRDGSYPQYHSGAIDALHVSYFRHRWPDERAFRTCNLRKSAGFHLVAQGADPLPPAGDAAGFYRIAVEKRGPLVTFSVNELLLFTWHDDGSRGGPPRSGGHIGFRQMAPLVAEYRSFAVTELHPLTTTTSPTAPGDTDG